MSSAPKNSSVGKTAGGDISLSGSSSNALAGDRLPLNRYVTFATIAACGCVADLITKHVVFQWLGVHLGFLNEGYPGAIGRWRGDERLDHKWWLWDQHFGFETSINTGALFGMGAGRWWVFASLSVVALIGICVWLFVYRAARDRWLTVALGFVTGGILGNLYDRLGMWNTAGLQAKYQHGVRDWILFQWHGIPLFDPWPNFNIADSLLVTGAIMLVVHAVVWREPEQQPIKAASGGRD